MKTQIKKLKNGTTVIAIQRKTTKIVSVLVGVSVGCEHEADSENGIAHFLEHMCFKGTKTYNNVKTISERHRHRYFINTDYTDRLEKKRNDSISKSYR